MPTVDTNTFEYIEGEDIRLIAGESITVNPSDDHHRHFAHHGPILFDKIKSDNMTPKARKMTIKHIMEHLKAMDPSQPMPQPESVSEAGAEVALPGSFT